MTGKQKNILVILSICAFGLLALVGRVGYQTYTTFWRAPLLGPAINMPSSINTLPSVISLPATWTATEPGFTPSPGPTSTLAPTITPAQTTYCNAPATMTILGIGSDARANSYQYGLADVIRIIRFDFTTIKVAILEFPRDLWVEIPDIADNINGQDHERLNQAYLYGNPGFGYYEGPGEGPGLLARTLALNFGINPDRYIALLDEGGALAVVGSDRPGVQAVINRVIEERHRAQVGHHVLGVISPVQLFHRTDESAAAKREHLTDHGGIGAGQRG